MLGFENKQNVVLFYQISIYLLINFMVFAYFLKKSSIR